MEQQEDQSARVAERQAVWATTRQGVIAAAVAGMRSSKETVKLFSHLGVTFHDGSSACCAVGYVAEAGVEHGLLRREMVPADSPGKDASRRLIERRFGKAMKAFHSYSPVEGRPTGIDGTVILSTRFCEALDLDANLELTSGEILYSMHDLSEVSMLEIADRVERHGIEHYRPQV